MNQEELTEVAYETYCKAVGGVAFNGDPLPSWREFGSDPNKEKQANAWRASTAKVASIVAASNDLDLKGI